MVVLALVAHWPLGLSLTFSSETISLFLTASLAFFAFTEMRSARASEKRAQAAELARRNAVDGRISAEAYALRRQIVSWVKAYPIRDPVAAVLDEPWEQRITKHFDVAERRITSMVSQAVEASPDVSRSITDAYVKFYRATEFVNRMVDAKATWPTGVIGEKHRESREAAFDGFYGCVQKLNQVIRDEIKAAEAADEEQNPGPSLF